MLAPFLPPPPPELVLAHEFAHQQLADAIGRIDPAAARAFVAVQRRIVEESIAYLQPISTDPRSQDLLPVQRTFLTPEQEVRLEAAGAVFRHLDARAHMKAIGLVPTVMTTATPYVFHALLEGPMPSNIDRNPGMLRALPLDWTPEDSTYMHPPGPACPPLVEAALDLAMHAPSPACVRAGYLTFAMLSIHPFADGNGRTARALYMAVTADELPLGMDWGVLEQWSVDRDGYIAALQAGQRVERYAGEHMDASAFVEFAITRSIIGAEVCAARLHEIVRRMDELGTRRGLTPAAAAVLAVASATRGATEDTLERVALQDEPVVDQLVDAGLLRWVPRPSSVRTRRQPDHQGLAVVA